MRTYRGVPLPEGCTRAVLRRMKVKLKIFISKQVEFYTCNEFAVLCKDYFPAKDRWATFLITLGISISGSGFIYHNLPDWFENLPGVNIDNDSNENRLILIKDILKVCYND